MAAVNSCWAALEWLLWARRLSRPAPPLRAPVFVLGHPRTGTTHLQNLLACDAARFATPSTFDVGFPSFSLSGRALKPWLAGLVDSTRPMDATALSLETPAEDEIAVQTLSGGCSSYMALVFPRLWRRFLPLARLDPRAGTAAPPGRAPPAYEAFGPADSGEVARWKLAFSAFLRKLQLRDDDAGVRRLLLKSPSHTGHVKTILELFPDAQFVYIHRHPLDVFASAAHMADAYTWFVNLQGMGDEDLTEFVIWQFKALHEAYVADRGLIPDGNLVEVSFAELEERPLETLARIYAALGWDNWADAEKAVE
ncbi:hypothetical protein H632_c62p3, partial [Helicosporidium sp. ATCC 50920]